MCGKGACKVCISNVVAARRGAGICEKSEEAKEVQNFITVKWYSSFHTGFVG